METKEHIIINGLKWDVKNLSVDGKDLFKWKEANELAMSVGKRLPTKGEWEELCALGSTWDDEKKGRWFGNDHSKKYDSVESIFLPAAGYRYNGNGQLYDSGTNGYYWSDTAFGDFSFNLTFNSGYVIPEDHTISVYGLSLRCIAE